MSKQISRIFAIIILLQGIIFPGAYDSFGQTEDFLRIDSVSVLPGEEGHVVIGWTLETSEVMGEIEVHRQLPEGTYALVFTIPDLSVSQFVDNGVNANLGIVSYYIAAFGEDEETLAVSEAHSTIHLDVPEANFCNGHIQLFWKNYGVTTSSGTPIPLQVPFDSLRVQYSVDGISFETIETFEQPPTSDQVQEFLFEELEPGLHFFRIQSVNSENGHTSTSNVRSFGYNPPQLEDFVIDYIDVVENQEIQISFSGSGEPEDFHYEVYRSEVAETGYELVEGNLPMEIFTDFPDILAGPWFYRVKAWLKDWECELPNLETPGIFSSLFLEVNPGQGERVFEFSWEHFFPEDYWYSYDLFMQSKAGLWEAVPGFEDMGDASFVFFAPADLAGSLVFKLEAYEQGNPSQGVSSNFVEIEVEPLVFIPNAIRPTSEKDINRYFKPVLYGFEPEEYELTIYNRWGQLIYRTNDPENGWDGNYDGQTVSPGVYSFQLRYQAPGGKSYEKSGVVTLIF